MKNIYVIIGQSTDCNGGIIHWTDIAYIDKQKAIDVCNAMNEAMQRHDPNYMTYVSGPILLDETKGLV